MEIEILNLAQTTANYFSEKMNNYIFLLLFYYLLKAENLLMIC